MRQFSWIVGRGSCSGLSRSAAGCRDRCGLVRRMRRRRAAWSSWEFPFCRGGRRCGASMRPGPERGASAREGRGERGIARLGRPPSAESRGHPRRGQRPCPAVPEFAPGSACFEALGGLSAAGRSAARDAAARIGSATPVLRHAAFIRALRRNTALGNKRRDNGWTVIADIRPPHAHSSGRQPTNQG